MERDELSEIRATRMAEMRAQSNAGNGGMSGFPNLPAGLSPKPTGEDVEKERQMEEMRRGMLAQILEPQARERLSRIRIVKQEKAAGIEEMIIRMAQSGQIRGKVSEAQLIDLLGQVNGNSVNTKNSKIKFTRRPADDDSDEELLAGL